MGEDQGTLAAHVTIWVLVGVKEKKCENVQKGGCCGCMCDLT